MSRAFFITLEGPEGSGKSSQAKRLVPTLRRTGRRVVSLHDPGTTAVGRRLRRVLLRERLALSPLVEALLFIAGRVQLVEERIRPALAQGAVIVCDRYYDSTMAYQGYGGGLPIAWLDRLGRHAIGCVRPDLTFVLDLSPEAGLRRVKGAKDRMERKALAFPARPPWISHNRRARATPLRGARRHPTAKSDSPPHCQRGVGSSRRPQPMID